MNTPLKDSSRNSLGIWKAWLHFNIWSFILLTIAVSGVGLVSDTDKYKDRSKTMLVDIVMDTFTSREIKFFPQVWRNEFQGDVAGERKFFVTLFYPGPGHHRPMVRHDRIYALINVDEFLKLGIDADHPVPVLKYGVTPTMENYDYSNGDVYSGSVYDVYEKNVGSYMKYNKAYWGVSIMDLVHFIYPWVSLPWGLGCGIYSVARRVAYRRPRATRID